MALSTQHKVAATPRFRSLRRTDLIVVSAAIFSLAGLAWLYLLVLASKMEGGQGTSMASMPQAEPWDVLDFLLMFIMWTVMMIGMMLPTAIRTALIYAAVVRQSTAFGIPLAATAWFVAGYIIVWTIFSVGATALQAGLNGLGLLSPMMASASSWFAAALLLAAGIYQLTPWKDACLRHCQSPAEYLAGKFRPGIGGAIGLGVRHGSYCLGCCWALMCLLFVGGVMNLLWIAALMIFVLLEKLSPVHWRVRIVSGWLMIIGASIYLIEPVIR